MNATDGERGVVMIVVLWMIAAMALLVSAFNVAVRGSAAVASSEVSGLRRESLRAAAIEVAAASLLPRDPKGRWRPDGRPYIVDILGDRVAIRIFDANGFIDLNKTDPAIIANLARNADLDGGATERLINQIRSRRGSERNDASQPPAATTQGTAARRRTEFDFISVDEISAFEGLGRGAYRRIALALTVFGQTGRINPLTAPAPVLAALTGVTPRDIETILNLRSREDVDPGAVTRILGHASASINAQDGPAYLLQLAVEKEDGGMRDLGRAVIMRDGSGERPYFVLDWGRAQ